MKNTILALALVLGSTALGFAQAPWLYQATSVKHQIRINKTTVGNQLTDGDYLGVFYDSAGLARCAGLIKWTTAAETEHQLTAYGADHNHAGFSEGEAFRFRVWDADQACEQPVTQFAFSHDSDTLFNSQGSSRLVSLRSGAFPVSYPTQSLCYQADPISPTHDPALQGKIRFVPQRQGLAIDSLTGQITPQQSQPGTYQIRLESSFCLSPQSLNVQIIPSPTVEKIADEVSICPDTEQKLDAGTGFSSYIWRKNQNIISEGRFATISDTGKYFIEISTPTHGCSGVDSFTVVHHLIPEAEVEVAQTVCGEKTLTISDHRWQSIHWSTGDLTSSIEVNYSNTYFATLISEDGCELTTHIDVEVEEMSLDELAYDQNDASCAKDGIIVIDESTILHGKFPFTYYLSDEKTGLQVGSTSMTGIFKNLPPASYALHVRDSYGCEGIYQGIQIFSTEDCAQISFTPNGDGNNDAFYIAESGMAEIYDRTGRLQTKIQIPGYWDGTDLNHQPLSTGYYLVVINEQKSQGITLIR